MAVDSRCVGPWATLIRSTPVRDSLACNYLAVLFPRDSKSGKEVTMAAGEVVNKTKLEARLARVS
jgi:hypothetical protein